MGLYVADTEGRIVADHGTCTSVYSGTSCYCCYCSCCSCYCWVDSNVQAFNKQFIMNVMHCLGWSFECSHESDWDFG